MEGVDACHQDRDQQNHAGTKRLLGYKRKQKGVVMASMCGDGR